MRNSLARGRIVVSKITKTLLENEEEVFLIEAKN